MALITELLNQGIAPRKQDSTLQQGELVSGIGCWYQPGDTTQLYKLPGRTEFGIVIPDTAVKGVAVCQFDTPPDYILAYAGSGIYTATPGASGIFTLAYSGWTSSGTILASIHENDIWYLCNGSDGNLAFYNGTFRGLGMQRPFTVASGAVTPTDGTIAATARPDTYQDTSEGWVNPERAYDADTLSYAYATSVGDNYETISGARYKILKLRFTDATTATSGSRLYVDWSKIWAYGVPGSPGSISTLTIDYTENRFAPTPTYTEMVYDPYLTAKTTASTSITSGIPVSGIEVRSTLLLVNPSITNYDETRIYDCRIDTPGVPSGTTGSMTVSGGIYYGFTEYDAANKLESPIRYDDNVINFSGAAYYSLTFSGTVTNPNANYRRIYRVFDGGTPPQDFYLLETIAATETSWADNFGVALDNTTDDFYPMIAVSESDGTTVYYEQDIAPDPLFHLNYFLGSLVGIRDSKPRELLYSVPGKPESWPVSIYKFSKFPLPEHDELVGTITVGRTLLILSKGGVIRMNYLPTVEGAQIQDTEALRLDGQPGCVGRKAFTALSIDAEPFAVWVSPFGIHLTEGGTVAKRLTDDLNWDALVNVATLSTAKLLFDKKRLLLIFAYDSNGDSVNDKYLLLHMGPEHRKANGLPKITGPHSAVLTDVIDSLVDDSQYLYSANSNGSIFREFDGNVDESLGATGNLVDDPSYEGNGSDWALTGTNSEITSTYGAHGGSKACVLYAENRDFGADITGTVTTNTFMTVSSGTSYVFRCFINATYVSGNSSLTASYSFNGTDFTDLATIDGDTVGANWYKWTIGDIPASDDDLWIRFTATPPASILSSRWVIDDVRVGYDIIPFTVTTRKLYDDSNRSELFIYKINTRHSDWGTGVTGSLIAVTGRDTNTNTQTVTKTLALNGSRGTEVYVGRQGEWVQSTFSVATSGMGSLGLVQLIGDAGNESGSRS